MRARAAIAGLMGVLATGAAAQTTVNPGALDGLSPQRTRPAPSPAKKPATPAKPSKPTAPAASPAKPAKPAAPPSAQRLPPVPIVPPAIAAIPPAIAVPLARPPPTPVVPLVTDAPGQAAPLPGGVRATFGADRADLNPVTEGAIRQFANSVKSQDQVTINVLAYAAGSADDPSTPRRLSLSRALAARAVLITMGIPSTRIYVRALGAAVGDGPADRVDVVRATPAPAPAPTSVPTNAPTTVP